MLPWTFTAGCANSQALYLVQPDEGSPSAESQSGDFEDMRLFLIWFGGAVPPFLLLAWLAWLALLPCQEDPHNESHCECGRWKQPTPAQSRRLVAWIASLSFGWAVAATLLGTRLWTVAVDDTTLCNPMLNAQYDGYPTSHCRLLVSDCPLSSLDAPHLLCSLTSGDGSLLASSPLSVLVIHLPVVVGDMLASCWAGLATSCRGTGAS